MIKPDQIQINIYECTVFISIKFTLMKKTAWFVNFFPERRLSLAVNISLSLHEQTQLTITKQCASMTSTSWWRHLQCRSICSCDKSGFGCWYCFCVYEYKYKPVLSIAGSQYQCIPRYYVQLKTHLYWPLQHSYYSSRCMMANFDVAHLPVDSHTTLNNGTVKCTMHNILQKVKHFSAQ